MSIAYAEAPGARVPTRSRSRYSAHVRPAPPLEPPYDPLDDERPRLALLRPPADPLPFERPVPRRVRMAEDFWGPQPTARRELPDPRVMAGRVVQATLEALAGRRPPTQLQHWMSPTVFADVLRAHRDRAQNVDTVVPAVRSVHVTEPVDGVAEVCAVVQRDDRFHAVAVRFEGVDGRWRCVLLQIG